MAPIKNIITSALMLTAAVAAPVELDRKSHAIADAPTGTHGKHHGQPMEKVSPAMSGLPSSTFDTKAMESSAMAAAANLQAGSQDTGSKDSGSLNFLNNLPSEKERRQLDELTRFLTEINQAVKRDAITRRQLGAVKSAPEAVGQLANVFAVAENLPFKRGDGEGFDDIGGIGHFLGSLATRAENGGIGDLTGLTGALSGLAKRDGGLGGLNNILNGLAKRDGEQDNAEDEHYAKHGDTMVKEMNGMFDKAGKGKEDEESQETPKVQEPYGLGQLAKRQSDLGTLAGLSNVAGGLAKREEMLGGLDGLLSDDADIIDALGNLARDYPASSDDMMEKREDMTEEQVKRQLGAAGSIATGALSNAGTAVSHLGKLVSGKVRRTGIQGGQADPVAAPMLPLEATKLKDHSNDDEMNSPEEIAKKVASGEETGEEATKTIGSAANKGPAKGPLGKRQVPPIAGADLPSVVMGIAANPSIALAPVTQGVKLAGTGLGDVFPK